MSSFDEAIANIVHREVLRVLHRNTRRTPVVVDSYDPATYAAKFKLMPDSVDQAVITGWIPLNTSQTGNNYGWHHPPNIGDHGWLEFHEDDREAAFFTAATFNDQLKPLQTQPGELQYQTIWGHVIYAKQDGSLTLKNGTKSGSGGTAKNPPSGSSTQGSIVIDSSGNITITGNKIVLVPTDKVYLGGSSASKPVSAQGTTDSDSPPNTDTANFLTKVVGL